MGVSRSTLHYQASKKNDEEELRLAMIRLAKQYGRYGYRKIAQLLRIEGWHVNHKKVERLWREEGLQLPARHKKRKRLYLSAIYIKSKGSPSGGPFCLGPMRWWSS